MQPLTLTETRVIGCLVEKEATTPDQYPLSLNSLTVACNQKSNREPVLELDDSEVQQAVDSLISQNLVAEVRYGSRVPKYQHRFGTSEFSEVRYNPRELAILCLLFLRGPQTAGELRTRSSRLANFRDIGEVDAVLGELAEHSAGPFVVQLAREPGRREQRWAHLFSGEPEDAYAGQTVSSASGSNDSAASHTTAQETLASKVERLEAELSQLRSDFTTLKEVFDDLVS